MQFFTCGFFFTKTYYKLGMLFLSGCRSKFSPWHHAVHVWHTAGLGGSGVFTYLQRSWKECLSQIHTILANTLFEPTLSDVK